MEISELIKNIYSEIKETDYLEHSTDAHLIKWLAFLEAGQETGAVFTKGNYVFATINTDTGCTDMLVEDELITENMCTFKFLEDVADEFVGAIVMYELSKNEGFPVLAMSIPDNNVPEEIKDMLTDLCIAMYENGITTVEPLDYTVE